MNDDVLKIALSPDAKYIAVALLDCTVKVSYIIFTENLERAIGLYPYSM